MSCEFKPGDEVVCVDPWSRAAQTGIPKWCGLLKKGAVYTVTRTGPSPVRNHLYGSPVVWLAECENITDSGRNIGFATDRFRKVQRRNSGLTIESFSVIKDGGFEEPKRTPSKEKAKEKAQ